jgi:hypothetical protein
MGTGGGAAGIGGSGTGGGAGVGSGGAGAGGAGAGGAATGGAGAGGTGTGGAATGGAGTGGAGTGGAGTGGAGTGGTATGGAGTGGAATGGAGTGGAATGGAGTGGAGIGGTKGTFSSLGSLVPYRSYHTATMLKNGKVLIAGGRGADLDPVAPMELFDPVTRMFSPAGDMSPARFSHSATLLANGKVLMIAGNIYNGSPGASRCTALAQIYDPDTTMFSSLPSLERYQCEHIVASLADGRILILGSYPDGRPQLLDTATGQFTKTGTMVKTRFSGHTATLLDDGRILVAGGVADPIVYQATAEVYNPSTGSFSAVGNMAAPRGYHTATRLPNGKVLIAGGIETNTLGGATFRPIAEIFDPMTNTFAPGPQLPQVHNQAPATSLLDNTILIVGGLSGTGPQATGQLYDPASGTFSLAGSLNVARYAHTATRLPAGSVLVVGGETGTGPKTVPAEIYEWFP